MTTFRIACAALALVGSALAQQEIGFVETFALAPDRAEALKQLVPGTEEHFYYHALHAQNQGRRDEFQQVIDRWRLARNGNTTDLARTLLNRQALLDYEKDPAPSLEYIRRELGLHFPHARKTGERQSQAPSALDPALIAVPRLLQRALANSTRSLDQMEDAGLDLAVGAPLHPDQRRHLLARLRRPDVPGLVDLILADLDHRDSQGFGHHEIHRALTLAQMDDLLEKRPALRNEAAFVAAYLGKLVPEDEVDLDTETAAREAYLDRVWAFVRTLDPAHNSLKACVLYHRLRHDLGRGVRDHARFLEYVKLPRNVPYLPVAVREALPRGDHLADLSRDYSLPALPPIGHEEPLLRTLLLHFLRDAENYDEYRPWIRDDYLKPLFAETKIVNGIGDPQQWAALLTPDEYKRLKERVDIDFAPENPVLFGLDDPVKLTVFIKNVPQVRVKLYEINTPVYYRETGLPLNLAINLDGLVATSEREVNYPEAPELRVERAFEFPELKERGVYVIEWIGNGLSSRALVQKGRLNVMEESTAAGHAFTVLDEAHRRLPDARAWLKGHEYTAGKDGRILVPFTAEPATETLVIQHGTFATLTRFAHQAEAYALEAGIYVDREALLRRQTARVAVRPVLLVNGRPTSLKLLEEPRLTLESVDLQGIVSTREFTGLELRETQELIREFTVPPGTVGLNVRMDAKVKNISRNRTEDLQSGSAFALNAIDRTPAVQDLHPGWTAEGYYVELRGKNGEPRPDMPLAVRLKHRAFTQLVPVELKTDAGGRVHLGALDGIAQVFVREPMGRELAWSPVRDVCTYPAALHGIAGEPLRVPVVFDSAEPLREVSLIETRRGTFMRDRNDALAIANGFLELRGLPAGEYSLWLKPDARAIVVRVTEGESRDGYAVSARRALEQPRLAPLQITAVEPGADEMVIRLSGAGPFTRVHVLASRFLPAYDVFAHLGYTGAPAPRWNAWMPVRTFYESGRDIGDEYRYILDRQTAKRYPGNMLERPGLLLNPWAVRDTSAEAEVLAGGGAYAGRAAGLAEAGERIIRVGGRGPAGGEEPPGGHASLDFLRDPAVIRFNLTPDADGVVRLPRAELAGKPHLRIVAADPVATVVRHVALPDAPAAGRDLRLAPARALDPARPFAEQKLVTSVPAGGKVTIDDALNAQFEAYTTLAQAYRLLATLGGDPIFTEFSFVATWPELEAKEQRRLYSKYACHELNFFLHHKDPAFFRDVIAPNLKNKKDKTFLDRWLLEEDLASYLDPWRYGRLNAVEQILLGRRLRGQTALIARDLRERAALIPPNLEDFNRRFDTALRGRGMEAGESVQAEVEGMRERAEANGDFIAIGGAYSAPAARHAKARDRLLAIELPRPTVVGTPPPAPAPAAEMAMDAPMEAEFFDDAVEVGRDAQRRFFQTLDQTKEWAENNYYHRPIAEQVASLVTVSGFWADYAAHDGSTPFLSPKFPQATNSFTEKMLALAVLELPFKAEAGEDGLDGARFTLSAGGPTILFHREIRETPAAEGSADAVLVAQFAFRADDRYRHEDNERFDKPVTDEFLPHVTYGVQVALTNPGGTPKRLHALLQIPVGALPVGGGQETRGVYLELEPYTTKTLEYFFYFPATGTFAQYPVTVARNEAVIARAEPMTYRVVPQLTQVDTTSWAWISQNGTPEEVLAFLDGANLHRLDLEEMAWRMHDREFFRTATARLETRRVYHDTLWSYAVKHNEPDALRAYLQHSPFAARCGVRLTSPLLTLRPVERFVYEHLEYAPLVNPRAHGVGAKRKILNVRFREQYQRFMTVLGEQAAIDPADALAVTYYLALQDRIEEALAWFARVPRDGVVEQMQIDYLDAYLAFYRGDVARAKKLAVAHKNEGVDRWRNRFAAVLAQVAEIEQGAAAAAAVDPENRDQAQGALAATAPSLELQVEAGRIRLDYRNLKSCTLNFYPMNIELLFSRSPFMQDGAAQFAFIRPVMSRTLALPAGKDVHTLDLPAEFRAKNVMVEVVGAGVRRTQAYYAHTLRAQIIETYGQIVVTHADTGRPVPGAYVKVYAKRPGGEVAFFKDGYTDLRGRFDYASVNTNDLERTERLAMLVLSDEFGALVREAAPPKR
jgi:hypothetical protein